MGLILIKISLQEKSYSNLKKRFPTMCETLEALRNPPLDLLEEEKVIKKVFIYIFNVFINTYIYMYFLLMFVIFSCYKWKYLKILLNITISDKSSY